MVDFDNVAFNIAAFIGGLFVLEFGADKFIDHTAKVAARLRIPPTLIALLTAGAEWEEVSQFSSVSEGSLLTSAKLVVVIAAVSQHNSPLALGNILGSSISNILGAFSLGLIFSPEAITFDYSAKIYTGVLLGLTTIFTLFLFFLQPLGRFGGAVLVATFIIYIASIAWAIYKGVVAPPEDSDSDDDSDSDLASDSSDDEPGHGESEESVPLKPSPPPTRSPSSSTTTLHDLESGQQSLKAQDPKYGSSPLDKDMFDDVDLNAPLQTQKSGHSTPYHLAQLTFGFLALSLSGYILSHSISTLADAFSLSSTVLGITFLSFATTLPEKLVAIFSGSRSQGGIVVANTAGSNIFLVTLCAGVLYLAGDLVSLKDSVTLFEVVSMWISSVLLFGIVMFGGRKWMGWALLGLYIGFIVCEFTANRR
jgi:Ca2+/Na+ antiporter